MEIIIFEKPSSSFKKPKHFKKNISIVYCPRSVRIEPPTSMKIDKEMYFYFYLYFYLKIQKGLLHLYFEGNEICGQRQRLWIEILNKYFEETVEIKKISP